MSTSSNGTGLRRSTRNQRNVSQRYNNNNNNNNHNNGYHNNSNGHNNRISGRKRAQPEQSSDESSDNSSDDESDESDYETSHSLSTSVNHNNRRSRRNNHNNGSSQSQSQMTQLVTQSSASQMTDAERQRAKKRKIQYQVTTEKWKQNQSNIQRRSTRLRYRKLADDTHDNRAAIVDPMSNQFMDKLEEQNKIYEDGMYFDLFLCIFYLFMKFISFCCTWFHSVYA